MFSKTRAVQSFSQKEHIELYNLMQLEFIGVTWDHFIKDFNEKQHVMVLINESGKVVGFSTLMEIDLNLGGKMIKIIFSGDTTVMQEYRDSFGFAVELSNFFTRAVVLYPTHEIYYVLISKGWRTYRVLPFFFKEFIPCYNREISKYEKSIMNLFGYKKYPNNYIGTTGLLCFKENVQRLKPECSDAMIPPRNNPHVDFFFQKNPHYLDGTELVCIARVAYCNFTQAITRLLSFSKKEEVL